MKEGREVIQSPSSAQILQEKDEYFNEEDKLIYCSQCNTPRQHRFFFMEKERIVPILCSCQLAIRNQEMKEYQQREFQTDVSKRKSNGLQDELFKEYIFANDKGYNPKIKVAYDYVAHWSEMKTKSIGLLLWGDVGTGKSFIAGCIANALLEQGVSVLMTNFSRMFNDMSGMYSGDKNQYIDNLNQYSLLIIDDLGIERNTEYGLEQTYNIIDGRYRSKLPMIVTTNLTLEELKNPKDRAHGRIYERILERCVPLNIGVQNIRRINATENIEELKNILSADKKN